MHNYLPLSLDAVTVVRTRVVAAKRQHNVRTVNWLQHDDLDPTATHVLAHTHALIPSVPIHVVIVVVAAGAAAAAIIAAVAIHPANELSWRLISLSPQQSKFNVP